MTLTMIPLKALFNAAYSSTEPPVPSKVDDTLLMEMVSCMPARNTHSSVNPNIAKSSKAMTNNNQNNMMNQLFSALMGHVHGDFMPTSRSRRGGGATIKMLGNFHEETEAKKLKTSEPLKLEWKPPGTWLLFSICFLIFSSSSHAKTRPNL